MNFIPEFCEYYSKDRVLNGYSRNTTDIIAGVFHNNLKDFNNTHVMYCELYAPPTAYLAKYLNASVFLRNISIVSGGTQLANGTWTGSMEYFNKNAMDISMTRYTFDPIRNLLVELPYHDESKFMSILFKPTVDYEINSSSILSVFPLSVWLLIMAFYVIVSLFTIIEKGNNKQARIWLDYFGQSFAQSLQRQQGSKIIISTWLISSFVLSFIFKNDFLANLLVKKTEPIKDLDELYEKGYTFIVGKGTYHYHYLKKASPLYLSRSELVTWDAIFSGEAIARLEKNKRVLLADEYRNSLIHQEYINFGLKHVTMHDNYAIYGIPVRRNLEIGVKKSLSTLVKKLCVYGIYRKIHNRYVFLTKHLLTLNGRFNNFSSENEQEIFVITLKSSLFVFYLLLIGLLTSLLIFIWLDICLHIYLVN